MEYKHRSEVWAWRDTDVGKRKAERNSVADKAGADRKGEPGWPRKARVVSRETGLPWWGSRGVKTSSSDAGNVGLNLGWRAKILYAMRPKNENIKQKQYSNSSIKTLKIIHIKKEFYTEQKYHSHTHFQKSKSEIIFLRSCYKTNTKECCLGRRKVIPEGNMGM